MSDYKNATIIRIGGLDKSYTLNEEKIDVLKNIDIDFKLGKFYLIIGNSGSGKSTLINILGLLLKYEKGTYLFEDKNIQDYKENELAQIRLHKIGFIFQNYNLSKNLKAFENVMLPMMINNNIEKSNRKQRAIFLLEKVGIQERHKHYPKELSGGEQQRVSIARALANDPNIILADEPTGSLDEKNETIIFKILKKLSEEGKCVIVVSHSKNALKYADIVYELQECNLKRVK